MKVAILNFEGVVASSVAGPYDMFSKVKMISETLRVKTKMVFEVDLINSPHMDSEQPFHMLGNVTVNNRKQYDLVLVPAMQGDYIDKAMLQETELIKWVKKQHQGGAEVASICMGAFLLAATGLLDGKRATTHWMGCAYFRKLFPQVILEDNKVIIDEGRIYSCGAAFSFTSLIIYLIEKFCGKDMALAAAKVFMIQVHDSSQQAFSIFDLQRHHADPEINRVQDYIEKNYDEPLTIGQLAARFNMSARTFIRKFTNVTGNTPIEYMQRVRIEAAKRLLEKGKLTVEQVCMKTGYADFGFFRNIFKRLTGLAPQEYKRKYGKMFTEEVVG